MGIPEIISWIIYSFSRIRWLLIEQTPHGLCVLGGSSSGELFGWHQGVSVTHSRVRKFWVCAHLLPRHSLSVCPVLCLSFSPPYTFLICWDKQPRREFHYVSVLGYGSLDIGFSPCRIFCLQYFLIVTTVCALSLSLWFWNLSWPWLDLRSLE